MGNDHIVLRHPVVEHAPDRRVSLQAQGEDVRKVLRRFLRDQNLDYVIEPSVRGNVTVDLREVTFDEAMNGILGPVRATFRRQGLIVVVR
ncbi:MAG: hypothetical protein ACO1SV_03395 [Fimbriimonas sp.]